MQIADSISTGKAIPGFKLEAQAQPVVYFDFELFDKQFEARYSINYTHHYQFDKHFYREIKYDTENVLLCRIEAAQLPAVFYRGCE